MKSPSSVCVSDRDVRIACEAMLSDWQAKVIALVGTEPGPGAVEFGHATFRNGETRVQVFDDDEAEFLDTTVEESATWTHTGAVPQLQAEITTAVGNGLGRAQLITLANAIAVVNNVGNKALNEFEARLRAQSVLGFSYRAWLTVEGAKKIMAAEKRQAVEAIASATLGRTKRQGVQCISTRSKRLPKYGGLEFSGKYAFRQFKGRPLLPASVWLARYRARKRKEKKNGAGPASPPHQIVAPPTIAPRPNPGEAPYPDGEGPRGRPPLSESEWIRRYRARKRKWNAKRKKSGRKRAEKKAPASNHPRPSRILRLKCEPRVDIYTPRGVELDEFVEVESELTAD